MADEPVRGAISRLKVLFPFFDRSPNPLTVLNAETSGDIETGVMLSSPVIHTPSNNPVTCHDKYVVVYDFGQVGEYSTP